MQIKAKNKVKVLFSNSMSNKFDERLIIIFQAKTHSIYAVKFEKFIRIE